MSKTYPRRPSNILYIDHTAELGGGEIALLNAITHLRPEKVSPHVLLFSEGPLIERLQGVSPTTVFPLEAHIRRYSKDAIGWHLLLQIRDIFRVLGMAFRVARFARRMKVDIIHTNSLKADFIGGVAGRIAGIPVVWHVRDRIDAAYLPGQAISMIHYFANILPTYVISNSNATLETIHLKPGKPCRAIASGYYDRHSGSGTDVAVESPGVALKGENSPLRIGLIGRIAEWKGQHVFIDAAKQVLSQHRNVQFEIIGSSLFGESEYEQSLHEQCARLGVEDAILFKGFVSKIHEYIRELDIIVHASTSGEPFGQVLVEGMAAEKPVIATRGGAVPEIVLDGETGLLVPMGDSKAMASAIEYLIAHPEEACEMGKKGRQRVLKCFTIEQTARAFEAVYDEIL